MAGVVRTEYREEPCKSALNRVKGMGFKWSLNPYMGCAHRCTFCFVRAFEQLADRPSDDRYGTSIRVKTNVVEVLTRDHLVHRTEVVQRLGGDGGGGEEQPAHQVLGDQAGQMGGGTERAARHRSGRPHLARSTGPA